MQKHLTKLEELNQRIKLIETKDCLELKSLKEITENETQLASKQIQAKLEELTEALKKTYNETIKEDRFTSLYKTIMVSL